MQTTKSAESVLEVARAHAPRGPLWLGVANERLICPFVLCVYASKSQADLGAPCSKGACERDVNELMHASPRIGEWTSTSDLVARRPAETVAQTQRPTGAAEVKPGARALNWRRTARNPDTSTHHAVEEMFIERAQRPLSNAN